MTTPFDFRDVTRAVAGASRATGPRTGESVVFVDVGSRRVEPNVVRDGLPIGAHVINTDVLDDVILQRPVLLLRVVGQSVAAGTPVPLGTTVDLVMAPPGRLPVGVVAGTHLALNELPIETAFERFVAGRPQVARIVARSASGPLRAEDEAAVRELFAEQGVELADTPGRDVGAAVETLRALTTFGGR